MSLNLACPGRYGLDAMTPVNNGGCLEQDWDIACSIIEPPPAD
jgi:hypothetical protein